MTSHEDIIQRMDAANPLPDVDMITDGQLAETTLLVEEGRRSGRGRAKPQNLVPVRTRMRWLRPAVAFGSALLLALAIIGAVSLVTGDGSRVADQPSSAVQTTIASTTTVAAPPEVWNPLLATTLAAPAPTPAACPTGTDPDTPGQIDQPRPRRASPDDHDAAFDRRTGRIMHIDGAGDTWAFDVCTNTWLELQAAGAAVDESLVYDVDSDVTIAVGPGDFSVYDAAANEWTRPAIEVVGEPAPDGFSGVEYDPISGLVITTADNAIWAFDVDAARLTRIGALPEDNIGLVGYLPDVDRLVVGIAWSDAVLVDPRTGIESPTPDEFPFLTRYGYHDDKGAAAIDTINSRLVVIGSYASDDVWGIDLVTSEVIELLEATDAAPDADGFESGSWNQLLATAKALPPPQPATCPQGTEPNTPGPIGQERPTTVDDDHDSAFDRRTGRVMYIDTMQRTWAFDVCTNTWTNLESTGIPVDESLVYDVDSDVTIALGEGIFSVYDATTNTWRVPALEYDGQPVPQGFWGVAYDPLSGLVLTQSRDQLWAFDVETSRLTLIGLAPDNGQLAGYVAALDRLIFVVDFQTVLVDPRSGETTMPATGEMPFVGFGMYDFFDAAGTVFIGAPVDGPFAGCGFNAETLAWDLCADPIAPRIESFASKVEDPINDRIVLIHHSQIQDEVIDAVWAVDIATGELTQLLAPSR